MELELISSKKLQEEINHRENIDLDHVLIDGDLDVNQCTLPLARDSNVFEIKNEMVGEETKIIYSRIKITNSIIIGNISFKDIIFIKEIDFSNTIFDGLVDFEGSYFTSSIEFHNTKFNNILNMYNVIFLNNSNFSGILVNKEATLTESKFYKTANFERSQFNKDAAFTNVQFKDYALFNNSRFKERAHFNGAFFFKSAVFSSSVYGNSELWTPYWYAIKLKDDNLKICADFNVAKFCDLVDFSRAIFYQDCDFIGAEFSNYNLFTNCNFWGKINFTDANLEGFTNLSDSFFNKNLLFNNANIINANLFRISFGESSSISFGNALIRGVGFGWKTIERNLDYETTCESEFQGLIQNLRSYGMHDDADSCYIRSKEETQKKRRICENMDCEFWQNCQERDRIYLKLRDWLFKYYCGYGVRLRNPLFINASFSVLWIILYFISANYAEGYKTPGYINLILLKDILGNLIGWILMPFFVVILANKLIR